MARLAAALIAAALILPRGAAADGADAGPASPDGAPPPATEIDFSSDPAGQLDVVVPADPKPLEHESLLPDRYARGAALPDPEPAPPPGRGPWPYVTLGIGGVALVAAGVLAAQDETAAAIGAGAVGVGAIGLGSYLLLRRPRRRSSPAVSASPGAATIGWAWAL
jgi:hypothetical protein